MRTGAEYRKALRDGRRVWVMGEGWAGDVTGHPATRAMVEQYAAWYDRHLDPAWQEGLLAPADGDGKRVPWAYVAPKGVSDLIGMGRSFAKTMFLSAGNITHTPAYGNLIALGVLTAVQSRNVSQHHVAEAMVPRGDRSNRPVSHLLRRRADRWSANAPGPARPGRVEASARERCRRRYPR
jgi:aromatic ring hydroxylase